MALFLPIFAPGWVWLVGARPNDVNLLTLPTAHKPRTAVALHDAQTNLDIAVGAIDAAGS
jgi:siroheme synthase